VSTWFEVDTIPVQIVAQPIYTVPIIFVPGIMGSNLMVTTDVGSIKKGDPVWLMDSQGGAAMTWKLKNPRERQLRLNPATTDVYDGGQVPANVVTVGDAEMIRKHRYWGEVGAMSYQSYLVWLEHALNGRGRVDTWRTLQGDPAFAQALSAGYKFQQVTQEDVGHAADMRFPVYACGYNWLQSNSESAKRMSKRIDAVIKANNTRSFTCDQVILITHSMGGLVARACSELQGKQGKIAGILHGVMPATGAAVAYKRVRTGAEGSAGYFVLGDSAAKVTAVFANAPGALQLLPSQHYPPGWLKLGSGIGPQFKEVVALPAADPYAEIYEQRGKWWGLVREELINPAALEGHEGWDRYLKNIRSAKKFHTDLGSIYHKNTVTFFGDGTDAMNGMTWGTVRWEARTASDMSSKTNGHTGLHDTAPMSANRSEMLAMLPAQDDGEGWISALHLGRYRYDYRLSGKDSGGDGTVPVVSGNAPAQAGAAAGVHASYHLNLDGAGHEGAYRIPHAQQLSLHAVLSLARNIPKVKL
jgi:pimeloyl-ACP methyl ester carboxylesterase